MNQTELKAEQRRLYPDLFRALDDVLSKLTLEQNVQLNLAVSATISADCNEVDEETYVNAILALTYSLTHDGMDPAQLAQDKITDFHTKDLTQDKDAGRKPGKGDHS